MLDNFWRIMLHWRLD